MEEAGLLRKKGQLITSHPCAVTGWSAAMRKRLLRAAVGLGRVGGDAAHGHGRARAHSRLRRPRRVRLGVRRVRLNLPAHGGAGGLDLLAPPTAPSPAPTHQGRQREAQIRVPHHHGLLAPYYRSTVCGYTVSITQ